ncbi:DUF1707 SHOCT-like domain-containing protein [Micromonospora carbonacea]|uniref:DUF1707 SHOCT-like domain-containing protein n=1 Tax=Micromonospora carbonacea TaxID=47853 RepID=UPI001829B685|nr:DUF1707 domain-containing protein [Micromonospora carbonacea]MBB5825073.1 hypothetical protein [Micromonospora carbonacea]
MNDLRVSDRDRETVVAQLGAAAGERRLTLAELGDRSGQAYAAKTYRELEALVADLPPVSTHPDRQGERRTPVIDHTGFTLSLLALAGGLAWMPLFPHLDFSALLGITGIVFGLFGLRASAHAVYRAVAALGFVGGSVGVALQVTWIAMYALMHVKDSIL